MPTDPTKPSWIEPPPPKRGGMGCFGKGCLALVAVVLLALVFLGVGSYFMFKRGLVVVAAGSTAGGRACSGRARQRSATGRAIHFDTSGAGAVAGRGWCGKRNSHAGTRDARRGNSS